MGCRGGLLLLFLLVLVFLDGKGRTTDDSNSGDNTNYDSNDCERVQTTYNRMLT